MLVLTVSTLGLFMFSVGSFGYKELKLIKKNYCEEREAERGMVPAKEAALETLVFRSLRACLMGPLLFPLSEMLCHPFVTIRALLAVQLLLPHHWTTLRVNTNIN